MDDCSSITSSNLKEFSSKRRKSTKNKVKQNASADSEEKLLENNVQENKMSKGKRGYVINLSKLKPAELLKIKINVGESEIISLLDTGADNNLIKKSVAEKLKLKVNTNQKMTICGFGLQPITTLGKVFTKVSYYGMKTDLTSFIVVNDDIVQTDIVLGNKFCRNNHLIIDLSMNKISKINPDESRVDIYIDKDQSMKTIVHKSILVRAMENIIIEDKLTAVPIQINHSCHTIQKNENFVYEGRCANQKLEGIDGIISSEEEKFVWIKPKLGDQTTKQRIRAGEVVGRISTIVELDADEETTTESEWTIDRLTKEIKLGKDVTEDQRNRIYETLLRTNRALSKNESDIGKAIVTPHEIELTDYTPIWQKPRNFSEPVNEEINRQCNELEAADIIEKCDVPWSSPIVPVRKISDGTLRMCVDYRKVNKVTKTQNFPMPNLTDSVYSAHNIQYFTKLDLIKGYYQVPIHENSRQFTAFSTPQNQFQFKRLSFGLKNSGIQFQKHMQEILSDFNHRKVIVYIDDILILSNTFEEHLDLVEKVLNSLMLHGIKIKVAKCEFFQEQVSFLGHLISKDGLKKSPEFIEKIRNYPKPSNVTQLRQFLGLANFQRKFIHQFSSIAKPLSCLTGGPKRKKIEWSQEMTEAYEQIKLKLMEETVLTFPDYRPGAPPLELYVDASGYGAGACLMQLQNGSHRPIAYASIAFSAAERNYSTIDRELSALRFGVRNFRSFLFGTKFIIYTDHKPLLYLHNMCKDNARLMRTVNELEDFDYVIKYRPGSENTAADTLSRIVQKCEDNTDENTRYELPKGVKVMEKVEGGGNSMFQALHMVMEDIRDEIDSELPEDHLELRKELVNHILANASKFKMKLSKEERRSIKAMRHEGVLPREEILLAACDLYNMVIVVHHGMKSPVVFGDPEGHPKTNIVHLQCISGVHFNPAGCRKEYDFHGFQKKNTNLILQTEPEDETVEVPNEMIYLQINSQVQSSELKCNCLHMEDMPNNYVISVGNVNFCGLIDTGAQASLITESVWNKCKANNPTLVLEQPFNEVLEGIGEFNTGILGIVNLKVNLLEISLDKEMPFAVVKDNYLPCCSILGANFIKENKIVLDFHQQILYCHNEEDEELVYPMKHQYEKEHDYVTDFLGTIIQRDPADENNEDDEASSGRKSRCKVKYRFNDDSTYLEVQESDFALRKLKEMIQNDIPTRRWREKALSQYKRYREEIQVISENLVRVNQNYSSVLVPFSLMVEIVFRTHLQLGHIGKYKLMDLVQKQFWHPSIDKVCSDITRSCPHCQVYKVSRQHVEPPTLKIQSSYPFEIVAIDLMQLPKTSRQNSVVIVAIDHYSKWLSVIPIKDKKAKTVSQMLQERILPSLPRIPTNILSDNGPEFKAKEFNDVLNEFSINHIYSTPYKASSNGCVERCNRTVLQLLKGLTNENEKNWDVALSKAVMIYNATKHSQTKMSPSDMIMKEAHNENTVLPIDKDTVATWKEGNPRFTPFELGQEVLRKVQNVGNQVKDKLRPKFDGPYKVIAVQPNDVTYVIERIGDSGKSQFKVHYRQIKSFVRVPEYLQNYIKFDSIQYSERTSKIRRKKSSSHNWVTYESPSDTDDDTDIEPDYRRLFAGSGNGRGDDSNSTTSTDTSENDTSSDERVVARSRRRKTRSTTKGCNSPRRPFPNDKDIIEIDSINKDISVHESDSVNEGHGVQESMRTNEDDNAQNGSCNDVDAVDFANENSADSENSVSKYYECVDDDVGMSGVVNVENNVKEVDEENGLTDKNGIVNTSKDRDRTDVVNITGDTVTGDTVTGDTVTGDTVTGDTVTGDTVTGDTVTGDTVPGDTITGDSVKEDANNIKGGNEIADVNKSVNECESEMYVSNPDLTNQPSLEIQDSPEERTDMGSECSVETVMASDQSSLSIFEHTRIESFEIDCLSKPMTSTPVNPNKIPVPLPECDFDKSYNSKSEPKDPAESSAAMFEEKCASYSNLELIQSLVEAQSFMKHMEKAWSFSLSLISDEMNREENTFKISEEPVAQERSDEHSFIGFGSGSLKADCGSAKLNFLRAMQRHSSHNEELSVEYRSVNNRFLRQIRNEDLMESEARFASSSMSDSEADKTTPIPPLHLDASSRIQTRSRGRPHAHPNVQTKTLEYKQRMTKEKRNK